MSLIRRSMNRLAESGGGSGSVSWPDQTGHSGHFLRSTDGDNGTDPDWAAISGGGDLLAANNLSDVASAATSRTNLGLVIGTDVQAQDAELAAIAGLTSAANKGITFTGSGTAATYDLTAFALTLLDDNDAGTMRATLDVDQAGTDNSTDVTLAGTPDYLTIVGQTITRGQIDLTTDVTGDLPVAEGGTGSSTASGALSNLGGLASDGSVALSADWDAGAFEIRAETGHFDVTTGTAPLTVASTTLVANFNADLLDGQEGSYYRDMDNANAGTLAIARQHAAMRRRVITFAVAGDDLAVGQPFLAYVWLPWKCTIQSIMHQTDTGTADWNLEERATRGSAGTNVFTSDEQSTTTYQTETSFANSGLAADDWLVLDISAVASSPTQLLIEVEVLIDTDTA